MKSLPWRIGRVLTASVLGCAALAQAQSAGPAAPVGADLVPLARALDAAWSRSLEAAESSGLRQRALAEQAVASHWLAAPPSVALAQREGAGAAAGARETEAGLVLPLWRPGQRHHSGLAAQAQEWLADAFQTAARWRLAGQLRELAGRLQAAELQRMQAALQRELLARLAADVQRRVAAGDLAPSDAMAAQAELLGAQVHEAEMRRQQQAVRADWQRLTGLAAEPQPEAPQPLRFELSGHPQMQEAEAAVRHAGHRLAQVQALRGAAPELGVSVRQERPGSGLPRQHSVAVSLRLPFGADTHARPQWAAALAEQELALTRQQRTRQQLLSEWELAVDWLDGSHQQARAENERAALLRQRAGLLHQSFDAGETALPPLLLALTAAAQADAAAARQQAGLAQAQARLHQAQGMLP